MRRPFRAGLGPLALACALSCAAAATAQEVSNAHPLPVTDASVVSAVNAAAITPPFPITGIVSANLSTTITTGGTAQTISGGAPTNGFEICNPDAVEEAWVSDLTTAAANGTGSYRVPPNGGCYLPPSGARPAGSISVIAATTGHKLTIRTW